MRARMVVASVVVVGALVLLTTIDDDGSQKSDGGTSIGGADSVGPSEEPPLNLRVLGGAACNAAETSVVTVEAHDQTPGTTFAVTVYKPYRIEGGKEVMTSKATADSSGVATWRHRCYQMPKGRYEVVFSTLTREGAGTFNISYPPRD